MIPRNSARTAEDPEWSAIVNTVRPPQTMNA